jgi:putative hydrolase of the HAD superfamily
LRADLADFVDTANVPGDHVAMGIRQVDNHHAHHHLRAILFDLGDTLMWEVTEEKDASGVTQRAELLPGAAELIRRLREDGFYLGLVADSLPKSPVNVLEQHELLHHFDTASISELVGVSKPDRRMFLTALAALDVDPADYARVVMVGNNLERDIIGANSLGLTTILIHPNDRRTATPSGPEDTPDHSVETIEELAELIYSLDSQSV